MNILYKRNTFKRIYDIYAEEARDFEHPFNRISTCGNNGSYHSKHKMEMEAPLYGQ